MTLADFELLSINNQANFIWNFQPLDERRDREHTILLYSLPGFYAEVYYHWGDNRIVRIHAFHSIKRLAAYFGK